MKLSRKKAIALCIELWTWCMETGKRKSEWPKWNIYGKIMSCCWFCEYDDQMLDRYKRKRPSCGYCPLITSGLGKCNKEGGFFDKWDKAKTPRITKKYAGLFLEQIKSIDTHPKEKI